MNLNYSDLRKKGTLFLPIIAGVLLVHLIGVYIYEDGVSIGVRGGSINIGIVGEAPVMPNPLEYTNDKYHDLILRFLFRSLIHYDAIAGEYKGDIGTCDIRDLSKIHCELNKDQKWSDGTSIQVEDIIATYQSFRENTTRDKMGAFLKNVSFTSKNATSVDIQSKEKNSMILDLLTYPIVRSDMLERIKTGRISKDGYITSGPYKFVEREKNDEYGYERVTIERDEKNGGEGWLDKYNFLFFPNLASLERTTDTLSVIIPPVKSEKIALGPRFSPYNYAMYEYIGLFANTDRLNRDIRRQLYSKIEESLTGKIDSNERPINNIFSLSTTGGELKLEKNFGDVMKSLGYTKPDERIGIVSKNTGMLTGASIDYGNMKYFTLPTTKKIYFSEVANGDILLSGNVPANTQKVYINGYELKEYRAGNAKFSYRVSRENTTLQEGKNEYALETEDATGKRETKETFTLYYSTDTEKLKKYQDEVDAAFLAELNTPDKVLIRQKSVESEIAKLKTLDPQYYYDNAYKPFELKIAYKDDPASLQSYASIVSSSLQSLSIKSEIVPISTADLQKMLQTGTKDYDYIIIGFEANSRLSRVGQVFLSTEAKNGINFARIESKKLDGLFAKLRIAALGEETTATEMEILDYMRSEGFFLSLSSPLHTLYIDKNLKGVKNISTFQDISTLHNALALASIKDTYMIKTDGKGFFAFFGWIFEKAFH